MINGGGKGDVMGKAGVLALVLVAAVFALSSCGSSEGASDSSSHINEDSGSTHGLFPDEREGTPPPPLKATKLSKVADEAGCYLLLKYREEDSALLPAGSETPEYESDPPSSGPHVKPPYQQADGAYLNKPAPINYIASLDHGRMAIAYAPDLFEEIQLELKGLYDTMYGGTLLYPDDELPFAVAAITWGNVLACTGYEPGSQKVLDAIRLFGKAMWGKSGSEPVENFPFEGPTPRNPEEPESSDE